MTGTIGELVSRIADGAVLAVFFDSMEIAGQKVQGYGFVDVQDGADTNPRGTEDGRLALDLWFHAGRFPWAKPLATDVWEKKTDGFWTPAGIYPMEKHTVILTNPRTDRDLQVNEKVRFVTTEK